MLVLTRKVGQVVYVGPDITVTVLEINGRGQVRLGFEAPVEIIISREELVK